MVGVVQHRKAYGFRDLDIANGVCYQILQPMKSWEGNKDDGTEGSSPTKEVQVTISIYSMNREKVYEVTERKLCPGSYDFTWDGTVNTGNYEGMPEWGRANKHST